MFVSRDTAPKNQAGHAPTRDVACRTGWSGLGIQVVMCLCLLVVRLGLDSFFKNYCIGRCGCINSRACGCACGGGFEIHSVQIIARVIFELGPWGGE